MVAPPLMLSVRPRERRGVLWRMSSSRSWRNQKSPIVRLGKLWRRDDMRCAGAQHGYTKTWPWAGVAIEVVAK
jgi:hypothetical protein